MNQEQKILQDEQPVLYDLPELLKESNAEKDTSSNKLTEQTLASPDQKDTIIQTQQLYARNAQLDTCATESGLMLLQTQLEELTLQLQQSKILIEEKFDLLDITALKEALQQQHDLSEHTMSLQE